MKCKKIAQLKYHTRQLLFKGLLEPVLAYGYCVWESITETNFKPVESLFLEVCLFITGAMKGTASRSCIHEAGLLPIRMRLNELSKIQNTKNQVNQDRKIFFYRVAPYESSLDRLDLRSTPIEKLTKKQVIKLSNSSQWFGYVDGSKKDDMVGASVYYTNLKTKSMHSLNWKLFNYHTIEDAEFFAICMALSLTTTSQWTQAVIFTDSFSIFSRLKSLQQNKLPFINRKLVEINNLLRTLNRKVIIQWIPSHSGIFGNEIADQLAKDGARRNYINVKDLVTITSTIPPNLAQHKSYLEEDKQSALSHWWLSPEKKQISPLFQNLIKPDQQIFKLHNDLNFRQSQKLTWLRTFVMPLNQQLYKMQIKHSPICTWCENGKEECPNHFLIECPHWRDLRTQCNLNICNDYVTIISNQYKEAIEFVEKTNRFPAHRKI